MSFQDLGLATLLLNNHSGLEAQKTLEMLNLFSLKITFSMKIKLNMYVFFDLILYVNV
jgi:hypothetical protein